VEELRRRVEDLERTIEKNATAKATAKSKRGQQRKAR